MKTINKKGLSTGTIKGAIVALIFLTVLLTMLPSLIHQSAVGVSSLSTELTNSTLYGTGASSIGANLDDYTGYFWVIGPLIMLITVIMGIFMKRR